MPDSPDRLINQRYAVVRLLGEGGMGSVYLVRDSYQGGRQVALKYLRPEGLRSETVELFKDEFRSMARLRHPNLAEVYDFGTVEGDGRYFLTMEYVKGENLTRQPRADLFECFDDLAVQSLRALDYIHSRGLLHNDIKPQNIMIHPPFQVKLLDFGLARGQAEAAQTGLSGTLHYVSPERFSGQAVDGRSDLFSLGVVLYEVLTGSLPHEGKDPGQVVGAILRGQVRPPRLLNPEVSIRLEAFVMALLDRAPASRPAGAAAALDLLNTGLSEPLRLDTPETYASFVTSGRFVGRDEDLTTLMELATGHALAADGDDELPRVVLLSGPSGIGKSRLLRELKNRLQLAGIRNLTGRCYEEGGVPFHPFVEVLSQLPRPETLPAALRPVVDQLLPAAPPTEEVANAPAAAERLGRGEFIRGVAASLAHLAEGIRGVVFLEDLHWSDAPGVDLLEHLVLEPRRGPWLYIGSLRDEEARTAPLAAFLKRFARAPGVRQIALDPLDGAQVTELIASMVPFADRPEGLARILAERTAGNPLYLEELMKALAEEGTLRRRGRAWIAEDRALGTIRLPPSLASAVVRRLAGLSADQRLLAEVLSVFNRPVHADVLAPAAGLEPARVETALEALGRLRLVTQETETDGRLVIDLAHSRIREAIYKEIPENRRRALHGAAGLATEKAHAAAIEAVVEELAHHFLTAGDRERAADYSLRAAAKLKALDYAQGAAHYLSQALELLPETDTRRRLTTLQTLVTLKADRLADYEGAKLGARQLYDLARSAGDTAQEIEGLTLMSWAAAFHGDYRTAQEHGRRALALARRTGNQAKELLSLNNLGGVNAQHGATSQAIGYFSEARALSEALGDDRRHLTVTSNLALTYLGLGESDKAAALLEESLLTATKCRLVFHYHRNLANLANARYDGGDLDGAIQAAEQALAWGREHTISEFVVHCLENLGCFYARKGWFDRALCCLEESGAARREIGDRVNLVVILEFVGTVHRELGHFVEAKARHREGLELARGLDVRNQEGFLLVALANDHLSEGNLQAAEDAARQALALAREHKHERISGLALCVLAQAAVQRGDLKTVASARRALTRLGPKPLRYHDKIVVNLTLGRCALATGQPSDAEREARAGLLAAEKAGMREFQWRLDALMGDALTAKGLPNDATRFYNAARDLIHRIAWEIGDPTMRKDYESDQTRQAVVARAVDTTGIPLVSDSAVGAVKGDPVRMLSTIYQITQIINSILDLKELLSKVMDLAIDLVGAERGLIFLYRSETDEMEMVVARNIEHQTIRDATEYSRSILKEAGHGRAILSHDAMSDDRFKEFRSVSVYNIRSLLCVPLKLKNRIIGTVYVDTRKPGVVFTEDDLKFLEAFANQAAIAIENARLYEQARQENQYLRQAVQERYGYENIVGRSGKMRDFFTLLSRVSSSGLPVMIRGESGTGKELVARAIHHNSPRRDRKFFTENCAALPDTLLESELFGHAKGAFTGADTSRRGLFELADGGTLFLDEVGDMSMPMQSKLLRVLQDGEFRPVGSETPRRVDVRVISATSRDLEAMIKQKAFREDLYFRLKVITVKLPPLRERREDIPLLVDRFLTKISQENKTPKLRVDPELMALLTRHDWPGNVRELENQVYRLALFASGDTLTAQDAHSDTEFLGRTAHPGTRAADTGGLTRDDLKRALDQADGNRDEAARLLGISRATFFRKLKQFQIGQKRPRLVRPPHTA